MWAGETGLRLRIDRTLGLGNKIQGTGLGVRGFLLLEGLEGLVGGGDGGGNFFFTVGGA